MTTNFKIPQTPQVTLYSSIGGTDTSIRLTPYPQDLDGNNLTMSNFGVFGTATIDPKVSGYEEIIGFTGITDNGDGTCTLTGVTRDLQSVYPYTGTGTGNQHGSSATVVFGINPQTLNQFPSKNNDETIPGNWIFSGLVTFLNSFPVTPSNPIATPLVAGIAKTIVNAYLLDTGSANTFIITPNPVITSYIAGQIYTFLAANANTGASTININSLGTKTIKKNVSVDLDANDILAGAIVVVEYDGTNFQLISSSSITETTKINEYYGNVVTMTIATPAVISLTGHNLVAGQAIQFQTTGALPTGLTAGVTYYVISAGLTANAFEVSTTLGGAAINTTGSQSGVHSINFVWTKPSGAKWIEVNLFGGGGGGAGGANIGGGAQGKAGAGGGFSSMRFPASMLPSTLLITTGEGGTPGASNGGTGANGGDTTFSTYLIAKGGTGATISAEGTGGFGVVENGSNGGTIAAKIAPTGGGDAGSTSTAGGAITGIPRLGGAAVSGNNPGNAGISAAALEPTGGTGGSGGGASTVAASAGGDGGFPGGGGGGGGCPTTTTGTGGLGGRGGKGKAVITVYF